jgi:16S rRNA (cytosine967-C5)-methyltransferase
MAIKSTTPRSTPEQGKPSGKTKTPGNPAAPARREAFAILLEVERGHAHSDDLLRGSRVSALSTQDRHLATALVLGTLRWQLRLDAMIRPLLARPNARLDAEVLIALRLGAFQLQHLDRIPAHAAIGESVALAKSAGHQYASGMVNAVLRKLATVPRLTEPATSSNARELAESAAHPLCLVERWVTFYGLKTAADICRQDQRQPELTLHLNDPINDPVVEEQLQLDGIQLAPGALLKDARRVHSGDVTATGAFQLGRVRIQEEGSQLIAELAGKGNRILDCCAAPGGKTLLLAERNPHADITAYELSPHRAEALQLRVSASQWANQIHVELADVTKLPAEAAYDLVLADVPCSGTGTLGRNPEIRHRLQLADFGRHHARQCAILKAAISLSSRRVVYSTCSLEPEENAAVVREVLAASSEWRQISLAGRVRELVADGRITAEGAKLLSACIAEDGSLMLLPGCLGADVATDGFFIAILERRLPAEPNPDKPNPDKPNPAEPTPAT